MRSSSSIIKSTNLVISRSREIQHRIEVLTLEESITESAMSAAEEIMDEAAPPGFSEEDARSIIEETEAIVKQLLTKAEQQASSIVQEARDQAQEILRQAREEGEQIRQRSGEAGYAEGEAQVRRELEETRLNSLQESERIIAEARSERCRMLDEVEPQVVDMVMKIARKVIGRQLDLHPDTVRDITREALERAKGTDQMVIKVHESSYEPLRSGWEETVPDPEMARRCRIEVDNLVEPGGCVIETKAGLVDSQVSTQLNAIENAMQQVKNSGA
ncbi:MAG: hypothetical protein HPY50_14895 [Firmicutes bacterium]|nr:hypothetical protein [Bacillota bacterium]